MNILAVDSSGEVLSAALASETGVWYIEIDAGPRHSELLMEAVDGLCKIAGLCPSALELAACMQGPGSFTGLRIAYSAVKGLALALDIPFTALPTLDCLAFPHSEWPGLVIPAIDAKQGRFFAALYRDKNRLTDYLDISPEGLAGEIRGMEKIPEEKLFLTGPDADLLASRLADFFPGNRIKLDPARRRGKAKELLEIVKNNGIIQYSDLDSGPIYLRKSDAELKNNNGQN